MKTVAVAVLSLAVMLMAGCGVNKDFVQQQVADSEARTNEKVASLQSEVQANDEQIQKLQGLSQELSKKTDMAINKAAGFENYQVLWEGVVTFDFDSHAINGTAEEILLEACDKLEQNRGAVVEIAGHTDKTGSAKYNLMLGQMRADAAKLFLVERCGLSLYRAFIVSHGENKPVAAADEMGASSKNRRVTLKIWGPM